MKLLIFTQKVNSNDPILGFFVRWVEEFAKHCEKVIVICLEEGKHDLSDNVEVLSLGKEEGVSRLTYIIRFYQYISSKKKEYDAVFVHMNQIYVILGGLLWRAWDKRISLWYTHKSITFSLRIAEKFVHTIFTASEESFRIKSKKKIVTGHGIDTDFFKTDDTAVRNDKLILSVGRLSKIKRHDLVIEAVAGEKYKLHIIGDGPERKNLESLALKLDADVHFLGSLTQTELLDEYRKASYLIHTSETGSMDKVVLEALATDAAVITTSDVYSGSPVKMVLPTPGTIREALKETRESWDRVQIIEEKHSLKNLIPSIINKLQYGETSR